MQAAKFTNMVSGLLIAVVIPVFNGGTSGRTAKELSYNPGTIPDSLIEGSSAPEREHIFNPDMITLLNEKAGDLLSPRWAHGDKIARMITAIQNVQADGLNPDDYHLPDIEKLTERIILSDEPAVEDIGRLGMMLSDAFLLLSSHLAAGKTDPAIIDPEWKALRRNLRQNWQSFIDSTLNTNNIVETLQNLTPGYRDYINLKKALEKYRQIEAEGGWGYFNTSFPKLEKGIMHSDVSMLRKRLAITQGYIEFNPEDEYLFDQALHDQVIIFQQRNGLESDGVVGKLTIEALNIPVKDRIETIEANLERWRWIGDDLGNRYIRVNAADFELRVMENDTVAFQTPAIVGSFKRQTPVFSAVMKYMVLNPDWAVPENILKLDIIPEVIKDSTYLARKNMKILRMDGTEVNPYSIDWKRASENSFPYMIKQDPGQDNPRGGLNSSSPTRMTFTFMIHPPAVCSHGT
jgi:murein L,D-transpeptidase YcbB/YkuD